MLFSRARALFDTLFRRRRVEEQMDAEVRSCFEILVDRYLEEGLSPEAARRAARLEFGGTEQVKEQVREARVGSSFGSIGYEIRYSWRTLRKTPAFTAIAILTLALGIGINTTIFSVVYAALLRPLPYSHPEELVGIWSNFAKTGVTHAATSGPALAEIRQRTRVFREIGAMWVGVGTFTGGNDAEQVKVASVTTNFLSMLGVKPLLGRTFLPEEEKGGRPAIVLTYGFWRRRFGGDPNIVGKSVQYQNGNPTVIGVLPADFQLRVNPKMASDVQAFQPYQSYIYEMPRTLYYLRLVARLKPGVTLAMAQQDLDRAAAQIRASFEEFGAEKMTLETLPVQTEMVREVRPALLALFAGAGFVMLICCVNLANLVLARACDRTREVALRSALGASQRRLVRQSLTEGGILCGIAGVAGLALGALGVTWLDHLQPAVLTHAGHIGINWTVVAFVAGLSMAAVLLCGLAPALESAHRDLIATLRGAGTGQGRSARVRSVLIVCEVMLGFVLVIGAGLMIRTFLKVQQVRPGFDSQKLLTFEIQPTGRRYNGPWALSAFVRDWESRLAALPGVSAVGTSTQLPLDDYPNWYSPVHPEGSAEGYSTALLADHRATTPGFLRTMGTRLIAGRYFTPQDRADAPLVAIVDDKLASAAWPGQTAIGKRVEAEHTTIDGFVPQWCEVVGVVEHIRNHSLSQEVRGEIYFPFDQSTRNHLSIVVRTEGDPLALAGVVRNLLRERDRNLALSKVRPMTAYIERAQAPAGLTAVLAGVFAGLALLLAAVGIYGVVYYSVSRRMREMGVRMALGARRGDVLRLVMREGLLLAAIGIALGAAGAVVVARQLHGLTYGISDSDPLTFAVALLTVPAAALAGCWRPAWKAAGANPIDAIRTE
jgi:putative ABC transport system permease protein